MNPKDMTFDEVVCMVTNSVTRPSVATGGDRTVTQVIAGTAAGGVYFLDPEEGVWQPLPPIPGSRYDYEMRMAHLSGDGAEGE